MLTEEAVRLGILTHNLLDTTCATGSKEDAAALQRGLGSPP